MLEIENGYYAHGSFTLAISLKVKAAELVAVLGPSGAGKSTLLNIIAGFETLQSGRLLIGDRDVTTLSPSMRPVSMVFQDNNVFPHLSLWQNVALGVAPSLKLNAAQHDSVDFALGRVGLTALAQRKPGAVSGGERQRVGLARVLVRPTKVLLLDEPFAALDPGLRQEMLALVKEITVERKLATLLVSHKPLEIGGAADSVAFIAEGAVHQSVSPETFFANGTDPAIARYLGKMSSRTGI